MRLKSTPFAQRSTTDCAALFLLAPLCAREPAERALWPRARFRSSYVSILRLTFELSGPQMRRTPTVVVAAKAASASLLTGRRLRMRSGSIPAVHHFAAAGCWVRQMDWCVGALFATSPESIGQWNGANRHQPLLAPPSTQVVTQTTQQMPRYAVHIYLEREVCKTPPQIVADSRVRAP